MWLGEFSAGDTIDLKFTTRGTTGAPATLSGSPAVSVYKGNGTTESTAGVTLTADFDSRTGLNHVRITTGSDGTFYADGNDFQVVITAGTVGGTSVVGEVVGHFTLRNRAGLKPTTAGRTLDVSAGGEAGIDWANVGSPTTTVGLSGTTVGTVTTLTNLPSIPANWLTAAGLATDAVQEVRDAITGGAYALSTDANGRVRIVDGTGVGELDTSAGRVLANVDQVDGVGLGAHTAGYFPADVRRLAGSSSGIGGLDQVGFFYDSNGRLPAVNSVFTGGISRATFAADTGMQSVRSGTAQAGTGGSLTLDASASAVNGFYNGLCLYLTGGTGAGQVRVIVTYNGTTKVAGLHANWITIPDATTTFAVLPEGPVDVVTILTNGSGLTGLSEIGSFYSGFSTMPAAASVAGDLGGKVLGGGGGVISGTGARVQVAADGLDIVSTTAPAGVAANFREMLIQVWRRFFKRTTRDASAIKTYADNGTTILTTQAYTSADPNEDVGGAT